MQKQDIKQLMTVLKVAYPSNYRDMTEEEMRQTASLWYEMFAEYEVILVVKALNNYIKANKYPPTIAGLQEQIDLLTNHGNSNEELWSMVLKAIKNSTYGSVEEYNKLPEECQRWLGGPSGLKDLGMIDTDTVNTVLHGQFLKTIGDIKASKKAQAGLSQELRDMLVNQTRLLE